MIIPLGHEQTKVRRLPWVTFSIMGLCVVVFIVTNIVGTSHEERGAEHLDEAINYFVEHPYLDLPERLLNFFETRFGEEETAAEIETIRELGPDRPSSELQVSQEQTHLDELVAKGYSSMEKSPMRRWGLVPADFHIPTVVSYQFLHGGFWHLFGNLFLLYLAGPFIEDVWGRPIYGSFYIVAGGIAGLMFMVRYPDLDMPLIGASGAVAGVMGAFLIRYWNSKIKFFYWIGFIFTGVGTAPAWIMLPLWFFKELSYANLADYLAPGAGGGGVAFWAHVWGFAFGALAATVIAYFKVEERFIDSSIESKITVIDNTVVESAVQLADKGDLGGSIEALDREIKANPDNVDAAMALWNLSFQNQNVGAAVPAMLGAMRSAARRGDSGFVVAHWEDMLHAAPSMTFDPVLGIQIAEMMERERREEAARETLRRAQESVTVGTPAAIQLRMARLAVALQAPEAAAIIESALGNPETPPEARSELETARKVIPETIPPQSHERDSMEISEEEEGAVETEEVVHTLRKLAAIPRSIEGASLQIEVNGELRKLHIDSIQAVAVGGINRSGQKPVVLVDLLLDSPWGNRAPIRTIRVLSNTFDPRPLVGIDDPLKAFQKFLGHMLEVSEAVPLPDPDAARGQPFRSYPTIDAYELEVLGIRP